MRVSGDRRLSSNGSVSSDDGLSNDGLRLGSGRSLGHHGTSRLGLELRDTVLSILSKKDRVDRKVEIVSSIETIHDIQNTIHGLLPGIVSSWHGVGGDIAVFEGELCQIEGHRSR